MRKAGNFFMIVCLAALFSCRLSVHEKEATSVAADSVKHSFNEKTLVIASALADSGYFDSANAYLLEAANHFQQLHNPSLYCACLNLAGANCLQKQDFKKAARYLEKSLDTGLHYLGDTSLPVAQAYNYLGELAIIREEFKKADTLLHRTLAIRLAFFPESHPAVLECTYNLGRLHFARNEYKEALEIEEKVLDQRIKALGKAHKDVALTHNVLGLIYYYQDEYEKSLDHYHNAVQITRHVLGKNHPQLGKIYNSLGIFYWNKNDLQQARSYFEQAIQIYSAALGKESLSVASISANLGMVCYNAEDFQGAINYYNSSLEVHAKQLGRQSLTVSKIFSNRGLAYQQLGKFDEALEDHIEALEIRSKLIDSSAKLMIPVYTNLRSIYGSKGNNSKAVAFFEKTRTIYNPSQATDAELNTHFSNIAQLYTDQQKYGKALFFMGKTRAYTLEKFGRLSINAAQESMQTGDIWLKTGNLDSTIVYYQQAIASLLPGYSMNTVYDVPEFSKNEETPFLIKLIAAKAHALHRLYQAKRDTKYLQAAYAHYVVIVPAFDHIRNNYKGEEAKIFLNAGSQPVFHQALHCAYDLYMLTQDKRYIDQALLFSESSKAIVLLNALKDVTARYSAGLPDSLLSREAQLKTDIAFYKNRIYESGMQENGKDPAKILETESKLGALQLSHEAFIKVLEQNYPSYYHLKYQATVISTERIQRNLAQNRALITYSLTDSFLYIFTVGKETHTLTRLQTTLPLTKVISEFRVALVSGNYTDYTRNAYLLYQYLLEPVQKDLASVRKLIIVPDAQIGYIPFDILLSKPDTTDKKNYKELSYVLNSYQCAYYFSAALWIEALGSQNQKGNQEVLGVAPAFNDWDASTTDTNTSKDTLRARLLSLKWAQEEVKRLSSEVAGMFLTKETATEKRFKQVAGKFSILHIATHAVVNENQSAYSRLVFSEDPAPGEDGYLHTYELYNMKLNASLVTLSACNTGTGQLLQGEGIISLARGFMYAGCPNVLMSLWPVNDQSTAAIMQYFYEGLMNELPKDEALHQAKKRFIAQAGPLDGNPYFWGSFVLVGDSAPVLLTRKTHPGIFIAWAIGLLTGIVLLRQWYLGARPLTH